MTAARGVRRIGGGILLPLAIAAAPAPAPAPYKAVGAALGLLPSMTPAGEQVVKSGAVVAISLLGRPDVAILAGDVALEQGGTRHALARGTVLTATAVPGLPAEIGDVFCEPATPDGERPSDRMLFGLDKLAPTRTPDDRVCLFGRDGHFDHAVLLGPKGAGRAPAAIPKVEYGLIKGGALSGDATIKLRYVGASEDRKSVAFDLEAFGFGRMRALPGGRHTVSIARLPAHEIISGAVITVLSYDAKADAATVIVNRDLAPGHIVLPEMGQ